MGPTSFLIKCGVGFGKASVFQTFIAIHNRGRLKALEFSLDTFFFSRKRKYLSEGNAKKA
jgi:hypothetical protein